MLDGALFFVKSAKCGNPDMTISGFFLSLLVVCVQMGGLLLYEC